MKIICTLTDKEILGTDGLSNKPPRLTARAILQNKDGLFAVMYAQKFNLYSLPGGGIEKGETAKEALQREILEETGCICEAIAELGKVLENRACLDYTQESYYFVATTVGVSKIPKLTAEEIENKTVMQWHTFDEMYRLIASPTHENVQRKYLQARDIAALNAYAASRREK